MTYLPLRSVEIDSPATAFGEVLTEHSEPIVQIDAVYGLIDTDHETFEGSGGVADSDAVNRMFRVQSGVALGGFGTIRSKRTLRHRAGQGSEARFTALFTSPGVALSTQLAGAFVGENGLFFGLDGTSFGINRQTGGAFEIQTLTVTVADSAGGNATVTLNGVGFSVPITAGSVQQNAAEIAAATYAGWSARQVNDTVIFFATDGVGNKTGAFTYAGATDGAGTFAETQQGAAVVDSWVPQASWNVDTLDGTGPSGMLLDITQMNVYRIAYQWLGAGQLEFSVENPATGRFQVVHRIRYANANAVPSLQDPSLKIGWAAASLGSVGTNLTVKGASGAAYVQGVRRPRRNPRGASNSKQGVGTTYVPILSVRAGLTFKDRTSQKELFPLLASASVDGARVSEYAVFLNPTLGGTPNWQYIDEDNSMAEWDIAATSVTGGAEIATGALGKTDSDKVDLNSLGVLVEAGDVITVAVRTTQAGTTDAAAALTWQED